MLHGYLGIRVSECHAIEIHFAASSAGCSDTPHLAYTTQHPIPWIKVSQINRSRTTAFLVYQAYPNLSWSFVFDLYVYRPFTFRTIQKSGPRKHRLVEEYTFLEAVWWKHWLRGKLCVWRIIFCKRTPRTAPCSFKPGIYSFGAPLLELVLLCHHTRLWNTLRQHRFLRLHPRRCEVVVTLNAQSECDLTDHIVSFRS